MPLKMFLYVISLLMFMLGFFLMARAVRAPIEERPRLLKSGVGAMAAAAGNALMTDHQTGGLILLLIGVMLIFTSRPNPRKDI